MEDFNFLHQSMSEKSEVESTKSDHDKIEEFGLNPQIIIVEDDKVLGLSIKKYLGKTLNCNIDLFTSSMDCLQFLLSEPNKLKPFCLITDISLEQGADGLLLIDNLKEKGFNFVSIAMTGFASIETAISATKKGVYHYLTKPFELDILQKLVIEGISNKLGISLNLLKPEQVDTFSRFKNAKSKNLKIEQPTEADIYCGMIGRSKIMKEVFERI